MDFRHIIKKIKRDTWWSEECPGNYQIIVTAWRCFVVQNQVLGKKYLSSCFGLYRNDFVLEKTSETEKLRQFYDFLKRYQKDPRAVQKVYEKFRSVQARFVSIGERTVKSAGNLSDEVLAKAYLKVYRLAVLHYAYSVVPESGDIYTDRRLLKDLGETEQGRVPVDKLFDLMITLSTYPMRSFMEQAHLELLRLSLSKNPNFESYAKKYHWLQNNYLAKRDLSADYFHREAKKLLRTKAKSEILKEIKLLQNKPKMLRQRQERVLRRYRLLSKMEKTFALLRFFSRWIDERKFGAMHMIYYLDTLAQEIARRKKLSNVQVGYYLPEELAELLRRNRRLPQRQIAARRKLSVYMTTTEKSPYKEYVFTGKKAAAIFKAFVRKQEKILKGFVASAPVMQLRGRAQVILNPHKQSFKAGRILVTTMTRPEFAPYMRKAAGIITDEGGITSHAAIVSRELGIPCIIGTKRATKIIKTGQMVTMDLLSGQITKR